MEVTERMFPKIVVFFLLVIFSNYARIATFYKQVVSLLLSLEQYLLRKVQMSLFRSIIFFGRKCLNFCKGLSIYSKSFLHLFVLTFLWTNGPNNEAAQTKNSVNNRAFWALSLSLVMCIGMLRLALSHSFCLWRKHACSTCVSQIGSWFHDQLHCVMCKTCKLSACLPLSELLYRPQEKRSDLESCEKSVKTHSFRRVHHKMETGSMKCSIWWSRTTRKYSAREFCSMIYRLAPSCSFWLWRTRAWPKYVKQSGNWFCRKTVRFLSSSHANVPRTSSAIIWKSITTLQRHLSTMRFAITS